MHEVALVEDQVKVELVPEDMDVGDADIVTVGGGVEADATATMTDLEAVPPPPVQSRNKFAVVWGEIISEPEVAFVPDQLPEAVQEVALVDDQVKVTD